MEYEIIRINKIHKWQKMEMRKQSVNVNKIFRNFSHWISVPCSKCENSINASLSLQSVFNLLHFLLLLFVVYLRFYATLCTFSCVSTPALSLSLSLSLEKTERKVFELRSNERNKNVHIMPDNVDYSLFLCSPKHYRFFITLLDA